MAYSTHEVVSDGTLVLLDIAIDYFDRGDITVYFDGVPNAYPWEWVGPITQRTISFTPAVPNGVVVLVRRTTDISRPRHIFSLGAQFTTQSMDEDLRQVLQIAQEAKEGGWGESTSELREDLALPTGSTLVGHTPLSGPNTNVHNELLDHDARLVVLDPLGTDDGADALMYTPAGAGAIPRPLGGALDEKPSLFNFMTEAEQLNVALRLGTLDVGAAILAAIAAHPGRRIFVPNGRYVHTQEIAVAVGDGTVLEGESNGAYEFGSDNTGLDIYGAAFEWGGAAGGVQMSYSPSAASTTQRTMSGGGIKNIQIRSLGANAIGTNQAATSLRIADVSNCVFEHLKISGPSSVALDITGYVPDHNWLNSVYGCRFSDIKINVHGSAKGIYSGPTANVGGGDHPAFCMFDNIHVTHQNGIAIHLDEMDDCTFTTVATSRVAGMTGDAIVLEGNGEGIHFRNVNVGYTITGAEAVPKIHVKTGNRAIYFEMAGIDDNVKPTIDSGAEAYYLYLGSNNVAFAAEFRSPCISLPNISKGETNLLDWYEEGTATPSLTFGGNSVGITYSANRVVRWVRIGKTVFLNNVILELTSKGSSTGTAQITGLPFTGAAGNTSFNYVRTVGGFVGASVDRGIGILIGAGGTVGTFVKNVSGSGGMSAMTEADFGNTSYIQGTLIYEAA